jgi:MFS family permease
VIRSGIAALREMATLTRGLRDLRVLVVSAVAGTLASGLLSPVLPVFLQARGLDLQRIGLIFTVGSLLPLVVQPALGALSDRVGRKGVLVGTSIITSLLLPLFALFPSPWPLSAALAAKLMLDRSALPVSAAMVGDFAPARKRATVFGLLASVSSLVFVAALVGSSAIVALLRPDRIFFLASALFLFSGLSLFWLSPSKVVPTAAPAAGKGRTLLSGLLAPLAYARQSPEMRALFVYELGFVFALDLYPIYLPLYAVKLGAPPAMVGPLVAISWLVYAFVQPVGGRLSDRGRGRKGIISAGLLALAALVALLGLSGFLPRRVALAVMVVAWTLMAIPDGLFRPSASALLVDLAPPDERGRFFGAVASVSALANAVAPLLYGFVAGRFGLGAAFLLSAAALLVSFAAIQRVKEPTPPTPILVPDAATEIS